MSPRSVAMLSVILSACAGAQHLSGLPRQDIDALARCMSDVAPRVCEIDMTDPNQHWIMRNTCRSRVSKEYRAAYDRPAWLLRHGCPEQVVGVYDR